MDPDLIKQCIEQGLECEHVEVAGDGRHFEAVIVSPRFRGMPKVRQHSSCTRRSASACAKTSTRCR